MKTIKKACLTAVYFSLCATMSGCLSTSLKSMSTMPLPSAHQPKMDPFTKDSETTVSIDGFGTLGNSWINTKDIYAGGGVLGGQYRFGGTFSPLFISGTFSGFGGNVHFDCNSEDKCAKDYEAWLSSKEGKEKYSFWGLVENISTGAEFNTPINLFIGFSLGIRLYQGGGDFDNQREELGRNMYGLKNVDAGNDYSFTTSHWIGYHIGKKAQYGSVAVEASWAGDYYNNDSHVFYIANSLSYFHPSGFHGGITSVDDFNLSFNLGKTFKF